MKSQRNSRVRQVLEFILVLGTHDNPFAFCCPAQMLFDIENAYNEFFRSLSNSKKD